MQSSKDFARCKYKQWIVLFRKIQSHNCNGTCFNSHCFIHLKKGFLVDWYCGSKISYLLGHQYLLLIIATFTGEKLQIQTCEQLIQHWHSIAMQNFSSARPLCPYLLKFVDIVLDVEVMTDLIIKLRIRRMVFTKPLVDIHVKYELLSLR